MLKETLMSKNQDFISTNEKVSKIGQSWGKFRVNWGEARGDTLHFRGLYYPSSHICCQKTLLGLKTEIAPQKMSKLAK